MIEHSNMWPTYDELMATANPPGTSWTLFGAGYQRGTLNFITAAEIASACAIPRRGAVFGLDYPVNAFEPYPSGTRFAATHHIFATNPNHRDDYIDSFYLQSTSQIDGLRHIRHPQLGFYGGVSDDAIREGSPELGIQWFASPGIVGRGVLLDVARFRDEQGRPIDHESPSYISATDLADTAVAQGVELASGDIVLIRTGWAREFLRSTDTGARQALISDLKCPGLEQSREVVAWLWDNRVAVVGADNIAVEALPPQAESAYRDPSEPLSSSGPLHNGMLHRPWIAMLGMVIAEMLDLEELADDCAGDGLYSFLFTAKPLNLVGGVGSPANAMAIK